MKLQEIIQLTFVASLVLMGAGCKALQNFSARQEWSSNYALMEGAQANDPAIIDGDLKTVGQTQYVESSMSGEDNYVRTMATYAAPSEAVVILPEPNLGIPINLIDPLAYHCSEKQRGKPPSWPSSVQSSSY